MKKLLIGCAVVVAIACMPTGEAEAGHGLSYSFGTSFGPSYGTGLGGYTYASPSYYPTIYTPTYVTPHRSHVWHDTSHYDYHPGSFRRHGNHLHFIPGHFDLHRTGHMHHNHP